MHLPIQFQFWAVPVYKNAKFSSVDFKGQLLTVQLHKITTGKCFI